MECGKSVPVWSMTITDTREVLETVRGMIGRWWNTDRLSEGDYRDESVKRVKWSWMSELGWWKNDGGVVGVQE